MQKLTVVAVLAALASACASTGAVPRPFPGAVTPARPAPAVELDGAGIAAAALVVETALGLQGIPYRNGGAGPDGFDCSGFTQYVFARHGVALPRETSEQYDVGDEVPGDAIVAGDLLFFRTTSRGPSHVAIAVGPDEFVHAPSSSGVVRIERRSARYWSERYLGARRVYAARN